MFQRQKWNRKSSVVLCNYWGEKMKKREVKYDFMRVLMSLLVICCHASFPLRISDNILLNNVVRTFLAMCNGIFFMLSGKFNLKKKFENKLDYYTYYTNKFINIIVPYGIISCILVKIVDKPQRIKDFVYSCICAFFSTNSQNHFWFMCCLIGMLVSAPFLAKMLNSMKKFELKLLFSIGIIWSILAIYLTTDFGISFAITSFFLWGWIFFFWLGYFTEKVVDDGNIKIFYSLGIIGYVITVLGKTYLTTFANANDLSAGFIFFTIASYLFLERHMEVKNELAQKIIAYLGKYSFLAYMVHYMILKEFVERFINSQARLLNYIVSVAITFVLSYLVSVVLSNIIIRPIQFILKKLRNRISIEF